jgi:hypothetical protein
MNFILSEHAKVVLKERNIHDESSIVESEEVQHGVILDFNAE